MYYFNLPMNFTFIIFYNLTIFIVHFYSAAASFSNSFKSSVILGEFGYMIVKASNLLLTALASSAVDSVFLASIIPL